MITPDGSEKHSPVGSPGAVKSVSNPPSCGSSADSKKIRQTGGVWRMSVALSVFFDDPFYIGLFERIQDGKLSVSKVVFGAEPSDREVYEWLRANFFQMKFSPEVTGAKEVRLSSNPKRRQRQAADTKNLGVGTKSQQALSLMREASKAQRAVQSKERREAEERERFLLHLEKKKAKHRGH